MPANNGIFLGVDADQIRKLTSALENLTKTLDVGENNIKGVNTELKKLSGLLKDAFTGVDVTKVTRQLTNFFDAVGQSSKVNLEGLRQISIILTKLSGDKLNLDGLKELTKTLKQLGSAEGSFDSIGKLVRNLNAFANLDKQKVEDALKLIPLIANTIDQFLKDIKNNGTQTELPFVKQLASLAQAVTKLKSVDGNVLTEFFVKLSRALELFTALPKTKGLEQIGIFFSGIKAIVTTFKGIDAREVANILASVSVFSLVISAVSGISGKLSGIKGVSTSVSEITNSIKVIIEIFEAFESVKLTEEVIKNFVKTILKMGLFFTSIGFVLKQVANIPGSNAAEGETKVKSLTGLLKAISDITDLVELFSKVDFASLIFTVLKMNLFFQALGGATKLFTVVVKLGSDNTDKTVEAVARFFSSLPKLIEAMERIDDFNLVSLVGSILKLNLLLLPAVRGAIESLVRLAHSLSSDPAPILEALSRFFKSLPSLLNFIEKVAKFPLSTLIVGLLKLLIFFPLIGKILNSFVSAQISGIDRADKVILSISEFFKQLPKIFEIFSALSKFGLGTIIGFLIKFAIFADVLGSIMNSVVKNVNKGGEQAVKQASEFIAVFANFIEKTIIISNSLKGDKAAITNMKLIMGEIKDLFGTIGDVFKKLGKNIDTKKLIALTDFIFSLEKISKLADEDIGKNLKKIFSSIAEIEPKSLKLDNLKGLNKVFKDLVKAVTPLEKLKIDPAKLLALANLLENVLPKLKGDINSKPIEIEPKINSEKFEETLKDSGERGGQNIADGVTEGVLKANFIQEFVSIGVRLGSALLRAINPLAIANLVTNIRNSIGNFLKDVGQQLRDVGSGLIDFGQNIINTFGIGNLIGSSAFQAAADFDALLNQLQVFGNLTDDQLAIAEDFANQIGIEYPLSSAQAADALLNLMKAGLDLNEAMDALPAAADLAALTSSNDINLTSQAIISATGSFEQFTDTVVASFDSASVAADIYARAANASTASVESLIEGVNNVGPAANAFGLSLEETNAILAIFSNNGIQGAEAGTALRSTLNSLQSDTARQQLNALGVSIFDTEGNFRSINDIIEDLRLALDALPDDAARAAALGNLADTFGAQGLNILLGEGANAIDTFIASMNQLPGASDQAGDLLNTFKGDVLQLQGSIETLLNRAILPLIRNAFRPMVKVLRFVVDSLGALPQPIIDIIANAVLLISVFLTLAGTFAVIGGAILNFGGFVLTAVGSIFTLLTSLTTGIGVISGFVVGLTSLVAVGAILLPLIIGISTAFTYLVDIFQSDVGGANTSLNSLLITLTSIFNTVTGLVSTVLDIGGSLFGNIFTEGNVGVGERIAAVFDGINASLTLVRLKLQGISTLFEAFSSFLSFSSDLDAARAELESTGLGMSVIATSVDAATQGVSDAFQELLDAAASNPFIDSLFGRDITPDQLLRIFVEIRQGVIEIKDELGEVFAGVGTIFSGDFQTGFRQIQVGLSHLLGSLLETFGQFTGLNLADAILSFNQGDLQTGIDNVGTQILDGIAQFFVANQDVIVSALSAVFRFLLPTGKLSFLTNLLGLDSATSAINTFEEQLVGTFGKVAKTVINLFGGQDLATALLGGGFSGREVTQITRALSALGRVAENIGAIFSDLFSVLFPASPPSDVTFIESVFNGIASAFELINTVVLVPLRSVLPLIVGGISTAFRLVGNVVAGLLPILQSVVSPITNIFSSLTTGAITLDQFAAGILPAIGQTFLNILTSLPAVIGTVFSSIGSVFGNEFLTQLGTQLTTGDFSGALTTVTDGLTTLVTNAIIAVPTLLVGLGETFGIPLLTTLGQQMFTGDSSGIITTIRDGVVTIITEALEGIPELLIQLGETFDLQALINFGTLLDAPGEDTVFDHIIDGLGAIVALPFDILSSIVEGVSEFITLLNEGNTGAMLTFVTVLGALALFGASAGASALSGIFAAIATSLLPIVVPALAVASAVLLLKNAFENFGELLETGDLGAFISDTLTGFATDLASFAGFELDADAIGDNIRITFNQIGYVIQLAVTTVINDIADGLRAIIASAINSINDARFRLAQATGTAGIDATEFFAVGDALANSTGIDFFTTINDQIIGAADPASLQAQLVANYTTVMQQFNAILPDIVAGNINPDQISAVLGTVINAGQLGNALADAAAGGALQPFLDSLLTLGPDALAGVDFASFATQIAGFVATGAISSDAANTFINNLLLSGSITPEQAQTMLDGVTAVVNQQASLTEMQVDVNVAPTATVDTVATEQVVTDTSQAITDTATADTSTTDVPVTTAPVVTVDTTATDQAVTDTTQAVTDAATTAPVTEIPLNVGFGLGEDSNPEDILETNNNLLTLQTTLLLLQGSISTFTISPEVLLFQTQLTQFQTDFGLIKVAIDDVILSLVNMDAQGALSAENTALYLTDINLSFTDFQTNSVLALTTVKDEMIAFKDEVSLAVGQIDALSNSLTGLAATNLTVTVGGGGGEDPEGRATGGPVRAGSIYEVIERGVPEMLQSNGRNYLLSSGNGVITPLSGLPMTSTGNQQMFSSSPALSPSGAVNNNSSVDNSLVFTEGDVHIVVPQGMNINDRKEFGDFIRSQVNGQRRESIRIKDRLRSAGRS